MIRKDLKELAERVRKEIPIDDLVEAKCGINPAGHRRCPCPFHSNAKAGSFSTFQTTSGIYFFRCHQCGEMGDNIKFVEKMDGVGFPEAVLKTACEFKLISKEEYEEQTKKVFTESVRDITPVNVSTAAEVANPILVDLVYRKLSKGENFIDSSKPILSDVHRQYLNGRGIFDDEIERYGYFSMPKDSAAMVEALRAMLEGAGLDETFLIGVPGFYRFKETGKIGMVCPQGIGIPLRDVTGKITAIQIRHDVLMYPEAPRYTVFSSSMVNKNNQAKWMEKGCGPKKMLSVLYPKENKFPHTLLITEGQFKAAKWCDLKKMTTITVQGVNNTNGIEETIEHLDVDHRIDTVIIGFDADLVTNKNVFKAELSLRKKLEAISRPNRIPLKVVYLAWKEEYGKGLDDVILAGNKSKFRLIEAAKWENAVKKKNKWTDLK